MTFSRPWISGLAASRMQILHLTALGGLAFMLGCPDSAQTFRELDHKDDVTNTTPDDHHHDTGPHGGHIVELGDYHGEVTFSPERVLTVYILDGAATKPVALEKATAKVHAHVGTDEKEIALTSSPQEGETDGKTSRFVAAADQVPEAIKDIEDLQGEVILVIDGKETVGPIEHHHDHDHDHDHDHPEPTKK